jgi:lysophospholipase L1-like esterase
MKLSAAILLTLSIVCSTFAAASNHWVATWGASPSPQLSDQQQMRKDKLVFENQTLREIVHTSIGSGTLRVRLSNAYGKQTVEVGGAHVALRSKGSEIVAGSDRPLTFSGRASVSIPPDALVLSDPVQLTVPDSSDLAISIFLPKQTIGAGIHYSAQQTSYIASGDQSASASVSEPATFASWVFLTGVDVLASESASAVVAFGDSITDGARSTVDSNHRWPNVLADRLLAQHGRKKIGVLDAGIGGNRILHDALPDNIRFGVNALARFDRDVLAQPGIRYVIVLEGINDLGHAGTSAPSSETVSAEDIIAGMKQMIERAHEEGLKIFGATLTPFAGTAFKGYFTPEKEMKRKAVNQWIRNSKAFDGVIDFERAVRDPGNPDRMLPAYDGGDHLHPGDAGYKAMGEAIDLSLFR